MLSEMKEMHFFAGEIQMVLENVIEVPDMRCDVWFV
jgi:hypothetical protein